MCVWWRGINSNADVNIWRDILSVRQTAQVWMMPSSVLPHMHHPPPLSTYCPLLLTPHMQAGWTTQTHLVCKVSVILINRHRRAIAHNKKPFYYFPEESFAMTILSHLGGAEKQMFQVGVIYVCDTLAMRLESQLYLGYLFITMIRTNIISKFLQTIFVCMMYTL